MTGTRACHSILATNGRPLLKCWSGSGCTQEVVIDALRLRGLWPTGATGKPLTEAELKRIRQKEQQRQEKVRQRQAEAAEMAGKVWKAATPAEADNPYLARKQVTPTGTLKEIELSALKELTRRYHPKVQRRTPWREAEFYLSR